MRNHANFSIVKNIANLPLIIRDEGPWDACPSVTNDAEWVVETLYQMGFLKNTRKLYYYDTESQLDEILHKNGIFTGFSRIED